MYQLFMKTDHPATHFRSGSKETLVAPDGNDETLRSMLMAYFESDYRPDNITVGIQVMLQKIIITPNPYLYIGTYSTIMP